MPCELVEDLLQAVFWSLPPLDFPNLRVMAKHNRDDSAWEKNPRPAVFWALAGHCFQAVTSLHRGVFKHGSCDRVSAMWFYIPAKAMYVM